MQVKVQLGGHMELPGMETTFTEDVGSRGARVRTMRCWQAEDLLSLAMLPSNFHAVARVAYCQAATNTGYVVGLEFLESSGNWVIPGPPTGENP